MADDLLSSIPDMVPQKEPEAPTWTDYGRIALGSGQEAGAQFASAQKYIHGLLGRDELAGLDDLRRQQFNTAKEQNLNELSPEAHERLEASVLSGKFWEHPFSAGLLKTTGQTAQILASALPGGVVSGALKATATAALAGGAVNTSQFFKDFYDETGKLPDKELQVQSELYRALRDKFDEKDAREHYNQELLGFKPALQFLFGALGNAVGPAGQLARGLNKTAAGVAAQGRGRLASAGISGAEAGGITGAQAGLEELGLQQAKIEGGLQSDYDQSRLVDVVANSYVLGAAPGHILGGVFHGKPEPKRAPAREVTSEVTAKADETPLSDVGNAPHTGRTGSATPPPVNPEVGHEITQTGSDTEYPKRPAASGVVDVGTAQKEEAVKRGAKGEAIKKKFKEKSRLAVDVGDTTKVVSEIPPDIAAAIQEREPAPAPTTDRETANEAAVQHEQAPQQPTQAPQQLAAFTMPREAPEVAPRAETPPVEPVRAPEPAQPHQTSPRILEDLTNPRDLVAEKEANDRIRENARKVLNPKDETPKPGHRTIKEKEAKAAKVEGSEEIAAAHAPPESETSEATIARAQSMLKSAREKKVPIDKDLKGEAKDISQGRALLSEARALDIAAKAKHKELPARVARFITAEKLIRGGYMDEYIANRRAEGDQAKRVTQGNVEQKAAEPTYKEEEAAAEIAPTEGAEKTAEHMPALYKATKDNDQTNTSVAASAKGMRIDDGTEVAEKGPLKGKVVAKAANAGRVFTAEERARFTPAKPKETITPKVKAVQEKVSAKTPAKQEITAEAAPKPNTIDFHGLKLKITHPKGTERNGVEKLANHYGEILRTEGADGDKVDVHVGPHLDSPHVFVVDQNNVETGKFDEHKVMLGFKDGPAAMEAYEKAFSDGRGFDRIGNITPMSVDKFKEWLKEGNTKKEAAPQFELTQKLEHERELPEGHEIRDGVEYDADGYEVEQEAPYVPPEPGERIGFKSTGAVRQKLKLGGPRISSKGVQITPQYTSSAGEILKHLDLTHLTGVPRAIAKFAQEKLQKLAGDIPVYVVSKEDFARLEGEPLARGPDQGSVGKHAINMDGQQYILLRQDTIGSPAAAAHAALHEIVHGATSRALYENVEFHATVKRMMGEVAEFLRDLPDLREDMNYALSDPREFIAEAFSNPKVQEILSNMPASRKMLADIKFEEMGKHSMWDVLTHHVYNIIKAITGSFPKGPRMMDAVIRVTENIARERETQLAKERVLGKKLPVDLRVDINEKYPWNEHGRLDDLDAALGNNLRLPDKVRDTGTNAGGNVRRWLDRNLTSVWQLSHRAEAGGTRFHEDFKVAVDNMARMNQEASKILDMHGGEKIVRDFADFERTHGKEAMAEVARVGFEASNLDVNLGEGANNNHLGKDVANRVQAKKHLPRLQAELSALEKKYPGSEKLLLSAGEYFKKLQNAMTLEQIKNFLTHAGVDEPGLAERIHEDGLTDADRQKFATDTPVRAINRARELKRLQGLYLPFRRYGDFVVNGTHDIGPIPKGATRLDDGRVVFPKSNFGGDAPARKAALAWAENHDLTHTDTNRIFVDEKDHTKILDATDPNSQPAYAIRLQDQRTEFAETESAARKLEQDFKDDGLKDTSWSLRNQVMAKNPGMMASDLRNAFKALEKQDRFKNASKAVQNSMRQAFMEASINAMGATKIQSRFQQRRNVGGFSQDLGKVTAEYAKTSARYLAKLRFQPKIDAAMEAMDKTIEDLKHDNTGAHQRRVELQQALDAAMHDEPKQEAPGVLARVSSRLLQMSHLDKLGGVSFHLVNIQEPVTTALPFIGGRHGFIPTAKVMASTYNLIGGRGALMSALKDTAKAYSADFGFTDYIKHFKDNIINSPALGGSKAKRYIEVLDHIQDRGLFGGSAIYEVGKHADPSSNALGRGLDRADLMTRQVGTAVESINRANVALVAYEMEYRRTGNHEASMHYALTTTEKTMGDYSYWNKAKAFKGPVGALAFQFKQFAQKTYYILGSTLGRAARGDPEAAKQFVGLMVTHAIVAGAMGLPLEPFKVALMAAGMLSGSNFGWSDVEQYVRERAAEVLGKTGGEIFSHGIYRGIGIETSGRQGWDSLMTYGAPRDSKPDSLKAWLWDTAAGAPASYLMDQVKSAQALAKGNVAEAVELTVPLKAYSDVSKAVRGLTPTINPQGKETKPAMSPWETGVQALGFRPARAAEFSERRFQSGRMAAQQSQERRDFQNQWAQAKGADRAKLWGKVEAWNRGRPKEAQLTRAQLDSFAKSAAKADLVTSGGVRSDKRNKDISSRVSVYNYQ